MCDRFDSKPSKQISNQRVHIDNQIGQVGATTLELRLDEIDCSYSNLRHFTLYQFHMGRRHFLLETRHRNCLH